MRMAAVILASVMASAMASGVAAPIADAAPSPPVPLSPDQVSTYRVEEDFTVANAGFEFISVATGPNAGLGIKRAGLTGVHVARVTCGEGYVLTPRGRPGQVNLVACVGPAADSPKLPATVTIL